MANHFPPSACTEPDGVKHASAGGELQDFSRLAIRGSFVSFRRSRPCPIRTLPSGTIPLYLVSNIGTNNEGTTDARRWRADSGGGAPFYF